MAISLGKIQERIVMQVVSHITRRVTDRVIDAVMDAATTAFNNHKKLLNKYDKRIKVKNIKEEEETPIIECTPQPPRKK